VTIPSLPERFAKLVDLMGSTTFEPERANARRRAEALLWPEVGGFDRALRILAYHKARSAAPNNPFAGFDEHTEIDNPGYMERQRAERAEKLKVWHARRDALIERYGSLEAVEEPCEREALILEAVAPWRVPCEPPHQRWTRELRGWDSLYSIEKAPADLRAAVENAYPMPRTFEEARAELAYWRGRNEDLEHAMGQNGSFSGNYGLDHAAVARMEIVRALVEHEMQLTALPEILERYRLHRSNDWNDKRIDDALFRDLEAMSISKESR